ncbi:MAG: class I SAM-dependent methyltransferase, partial [Candidatus Margulisiibacteriota bacterium]
MTQSISQKLIHFFETTLNTYSVDSPEVVGWSTRKTQHLRFQLLNEIACLDDASLLDVGCGVGDYWSYLRSSAPTVKYVGIDLNPRMISFAKKKYPQGAFIHQSLEEMEQKY